MTHHQRMVILGAGTGGTLAANRLRKRFSTSELEIDVVDQPIRLAVIFQANGLGDVCAH